MWVACFSFFFFFFFFSFLFFFLEYLFLMRMCVCIYLSILSDQRNSDKVERNKLKMSFFIFLEFTMYALLKAILKVCTYVNKYLNINQIIDLKHYPNNWNRMFKILTDN